MSDNNIQVVDLYQPIKSARVGHPPVVLKVQVTHSAAHYVGGVPPSSTVVEDYILYSALPVELRERVKMAVQSVLSLGV